MKSRHVYALGIAVLLIAGPVSLRAAGPGTATVKVPDATLDERIEKRINADARLKKYKIDVVVTDGVALLTGTVPTKTDSLKATRLATITGVGRVDNQLVVDMNLKGAAGTIGNKTKEVAEATKDGAVKVGEKTKDGAEKVAEKTKEGLSKTGETITDGWITSRVHQKFVGEDLLKDSDINVDTQDHVVTLKGTVMSAAGSSRAAAQAKEVEGVHSVVNHLTIGPKKP